MADGFQVPEIPLFDVAGSAGIVDPAQNVVGMEKAGTAGLLMVTFSVNVDPQTDGVKT